MRLNRLSTSANATNTNKNAKIKEGNNNDNGNGNDNGNDNDKDEIENENESESEKSTKTRTRAREREKGERKIVPEITLSGKSSRPMKGLSWATYKQVGILTGSQLITNLGFGCVIPVLPLFAVEMGLGPSGVGLILSTTALSRLILNIPAGRLADRVGRRPPMVSLDS